MWLRNSGDEGCSLDLYGQCEATLLLWERDGAGEEVNFVRVLGRRAFAARADVNFSNEKDESDEQENDRCRVGCIALGLGWLRAGELQSSAQ